MTEEIQITLIRQDQADRNKVRRIVPGLPIDPYASFAARWEHNGNPVGVWVRYSQKVSHRYAFSVLMEGVWEALQLPDKFDIRVKDGMDATGNPPPYATLEEDPSS